MHFDKFYTALFSHNTCTLSFYKNMAKKSAESYVSIKGNDKAISILQNIIKVMVVLKKGRWSMKTWQDSMVIYPFYSSISDVQTNEQKTNKLKNHQ